MSNEQITEKYDYVKIQDTVIKVDNNVKFIECDEYKGTYILRIETGTRLFMFEFKTKTECDKVFEELLKVLGEHAKIKEVL